MSPKAQVKGTHRASKYAFERVLNRSRSAFVRAPGLSPAAIVALAAGWPSSSADSVPRRCRLPPMLRARNP